MLNNKGQTLVLFVILIPIILILVGFITDIGLLALEKVKVDNTIKDVLKNSYGKENSEIITLLKKNDSDINIMGISNNDGILNIEIFKEYKGNIFKRKYDIHFKYKVYMENDKVIIRKE